MEKSIIDHIAIFIFRKLQYTKLIAANMRQPKHFLIGNITKRLMRFGNLAMIPDCVERLNVNHGDVVVEVGSGNGQAVDEILLKDPQKVFAFEISKTFLADLRSKFSNNPKVKILDQDAKQSGNVIEEKSVDRILLINVIYFLSPLEDYLLEFKRILKSEGSILIAGKFGPASQMDQSVFTNTNVEELVANLENYFSVTSEFVDLGSPISRYNAIKLTNKSE